MLAHLIRKELLSHLRTLRLVIALVFTVLLCSLTTLMGSLDFSGSVDAFEQQRKQLREQIAATPIYRNLQPNLLVPPQPLTVLARGAVEGSAMGFNVTVERKRMSSYLIGSASYDDLMLILVRTDFTTVIALVLSFLAVVLGFDAICGEREQGTLKLVLSNPVSRGQLVAAKLLGGGIALWLSLAVAFTIALLILLTNSTIHFSADDWLRLTLIFALSCLLLLVVYALSVMVSTFTRSPATSLILCLFGWLICGVGYANALPALCRYGIEYEPYPRYQKRWEEIDGRYWQDINEWEAAHAHPGDAWVQYHSVNNARRYMHPEGAAWQVQRSRYEFDRLQQRADEEHAARWPNQEPLALQEYAVDRWSILSPLTNYRTLCKWLARSTLDDRFQVARAGFTYRVSWLQWMRGKMDGGQWHRWFTDDPPGQEPLIADPAAVTAQMLQPDAAFMQARLAWAAEQDRRTADDGRRSLDLEGMPKMGDDWRRTLGESLERMTPGLTVLLLTLALAVSATVLRFSNYRVDR